MKKPLTLKERCELMWVRNLQQLNCYEQLVRKVSQGQSLSGVAHWAMQLGIEGEVGRWSFHTWRRYLGALEKRVGRIVVRQERVEVRPLEFQAVIEEVESQADACGHARGHTEGCREVGQQVKKTVKELDSKTMLKHCYVIQLGRVQQQLEFEQKTKFLTPDGDKNIAVLKEMADSVPKLEIGEQWMKGKDDALPYGGPFQGGLLPHPQTELSDVAKEMAQFDAVDRHLIIEATVLLDRMVQNEVAKLMARLLVLAIDTGGEVAVEETASEPAVGPDV
jgi:hypothetical protein